MTPPLTGTRCLVIGAGGFIGSHLCRDLAAIGAHVSAFGRLPRFANPDRTIAWVAHDIDDRDALKDEVADADIVFHLLGSADPAASNRDPIGTLQRSINIDGTIIELCAKRPVKRLIFVSSGGTVYGPARHLPIDEEHPTDPTSAYGVAKLCTEKLLQLQCQLNGLDYVILRVANPYGPRQDPRRGQGVVSKLLYHALRGETVEIWGDGSAVRDYLYVSDLVAALIAAATVPLDTRTFNIGSGMGRSLTDILAAVETLIGWPVKRIHLPAAAAAIPANVLDCTRARAALRWQPTVDWHDGLARTAQWIADQFESEGVAIS